MMTVEQIKTKLNQEKYFVNREIKPGTDKEILLLCQKTSDTDYIALPKIETTKGKISAYHHLLNQCNNQLLNPTVALTGLEYLLRVIDGDVFDAYEQREKSIEKCLKRLEDVQSDDNEYGDNQYIVKTARGRPNDFTYFVVDLSEGVLAEIDGYLLSNELKEGAPLVKYPKLILRSLKDNLNNEYEAKYNAEIRKWELI